MATNIAAATAPPPSSTLPATVEAMVDDVASVASSSLRLGGPALRGFFDAVNSGLRFLEKEAAHAEASAALDEARANVALVGDGAMQTMAGTTTTTQQPNSQRRRRCSRRAPAPDWAWVADHLLTLVQQYSGGLSEPVMRTSLWQAWRQLVSRSFFPSVFFSLLRFLTSTSPDDLEKKSKPPDGEPTPQLRWTALSTLLESAASDPVPRSATRGPDTVCVRLSGIRNAEAAEANSTSSSSPSPSPPLLEVSDASTQGSTCDALLHSSLEASALKAEGTLVRAIGGTLRMSGVVAWRPTGLKIREEEEAEEEEEEEGDENVATDDRDAKRKKAPNDNNFVRPFLLPTPAVLLVAPDLPRAAILAGRGDGAPAALSPVSAVASSSSSSSSSNSSPVVAAGVVVSVGPLERDFGTAAAARAASGIARVVWLSDDYFERGGGEGKGAAVETAPKQAPPPPPTPLLLLDALAAAGDALSPGEVLLLPGATRVPPPPEAPSEKFPPPCALEARPGALLVVVPCSSDSSDSASSINGGDGDDEGLTTAAAAARPLSSQRSESRRPRFYSLRTGVSRVAVAGTLVSSSLVASSCRRGGGAGGRKARQQMQAGGRSGRNSSKERDLSLILDDGSGATVELLLPSATAPRSAWAARAGEVVVATAARASVERKESEGTGGGEIASFVVVPASRCAFQSLPRLPALLASPSLAAPGLAPLKKALELMLSPDEKDGKEKENPRCCALVDSVVAAAPAVSVRRAHSSCGRPLRRSALDPSLMAEMMMLMEEEEEEGGDGGMAGFGVSEKKSGSEVAAVAVAPAALAPPPAATTAGSLVLSVPAPTPGPSKGSSSSGKKRQQPATTTTPAAGAGRANAEADDAGLLWSCDFCGVDCSASGVSLSLELDLKLSEGRGGGEGATATARAEGAAAASLLGCVPSEFVAWTFKQRAARATALEGRKVRVALVASSSSSAAAADGNAIIDVAGVMVLDDEEEEDEESEGDDDRG